MLECPTPYFRFDDTVEVAKNYLNSSRGGMFFHDYFNGFMFLKGLRCLKMSKIILLSKFFFFREKKKFKGIH